MINIIHKKYKNKIKRHGVKLLVIAGFSGVLYSAASLREVTVTVQVDAYSEEIKTTARTPEELKKTLGKENARSVTPSDKTLQNGDKITFSTKKKILLQIGGGEKKEVETFALTYADLVEEFNLDTPVEKTALVSSIKDETFLAETQEIKIDEIKTDTQEVQIKRDLPVQEIKVDTLNEGQTKLIEGVPQEIIETYKVVHTNGVETTKEKVSEKTITEGKAPIKQIGTKKVVADSSNTSTAPKVGSVSLSGDKQSWMKAAGIAESDYQYVDYIIQKESGWNFKAQNSSSGAYGLPQSLPGSKMASAGSDWATNPVTQLKWADGYAKGRYGSWANAYSAWLSKHWW